MEIKEPRLTILSFLECEFRGLWKDESIRRILESYTGKIDLVEHTAPFHVERYTEMEDDCELWLVRPDGLKRNFIFKKGALLDVSGTTVKFNQNFVNDELSVDENKD